MMADIPIEQGKAEPFFAISTMLDVLFIDDLVDILVTSTIERRLRAGDTW